MHDLWHLDHKILESLWLLVRRPGFLAEEYLAGRRMRHVPPFRLYVIASFALFLAFSFVKVGNAHSGPAAIQLHASVGPAPGAAAEPAAPVQSTAQAKAKTPQKPAWAESLKTRAKEAQKDPERFYHAFLSNLSKSLFVLMPVFAGLLMLLHLRRTQSFFVDHMVVALHHHVVCFLVILLLMGLAALPGEDWGCLPGVLLFLTPPLHLAASLQRLYRRGWLRSLAKAALISAVYGCIVSVALVGLLLWSLPKAG
ncbi:DUF3667 domain-containing protein [Geothrix sp. PMB-07]|uniref:DUF3667 domain-containing protein n=1 Tax=Geothrix sp. PMB-07 TaxID=3068640 RepID=UPI002742186D|nr:DUF3667 domain-containing protein [Geothrix sp. PMB-07]WLT30473.1 DUF3667 domain-containing protein [Geothrix sp. PMB-07]